MPASKVDERELIEQLALLFRDHGYEGASLTRIAAATGLRRASLYHRFPGGKLEMARAVLDHVGRVFGDEIIAPLSADGDPATRVRSAAKALERFYEGGKRPCALEALSIGEQRPDLDPVIRSSLEALLEGLAKAARDAGASRAEAKRRAQEAFARLQGSLILARAAGDTQPFKRLIRELPELLVG
ncbi:MAG: TetR/AcrR family transcriptional regulator [Planctomycetota bacterium]